MRKILFSFGFVFFLMESADSQSFYQLSFKSITNENVSLNSYAGEKVFFFIAPLNQNDSSFIQLQTFKSRYLDTIKIIGILSFEDGFQTGNISAIQSLYANTGILLTEGMYTKKTSGTNQSALMKWLTDKAKNSHFDMDAKGIGHKFFVSAGGRLFGVLVPQTPLDAPIIDQIVHSTGQ